MIKGLVAGSVNLVLAFVSGAQPPAISVVGLSLALGFAGYGVSLVLFGAGPAPPGRGATGAHSSAAPFLGAVLGLGLLNEQITWQLIVAGLLMGLGDPAAPDRGA